MRAIVLCGVSGTGKTWARQNDPELSCLPHIDIADVYREAAEKYPGFALDWLTATEQVLKRVEAIVRYNSEAVVLVEGYFLEGTKSRAMLDTGLRILGCEREYRELWAPYEVCLERLLAQEASGEISAAENRRRIELLNKCWRPKDERQ